MEITNKVVMYIFLSIRKYLAKKILLVYFLTFLDVLGLSLFLKFNIFIPVDFSETYTIITKKTLKAPLFDF